MAVRKGFQYLPNRAWPLLAQRARPTTNVSTVTSRRPPVQMPVLRHDSLATRGLPPAPISPFSDDNGRWEAHRPITLPAPERHFADVAAEPPHGAGAQ